MRSFLLTAVLFSLSSISLISDHGHVMAMDSVKAKEYTNEFAVHVDGGPEEADRIAREHGFTNTGQIGSLDEHYLFVHDHVHKRSLDYAHEQHSSLASHPKVVWVEQQHVKTRRKRDGPPPPPPSSSPPASSGRRTFYQAARISDPLYAEQWYLNHGARGGYDMNVAGAWALGYTGKKVVVTILDDGIQPDHPDLAFNYDPQASFDINDNDADPTPQDNGDNKHGTRCAGEVAAQAYNEFCGVGIAYNASIGGVRMLDGTVTDQVEARALSLNPDHIDIYSASWGPEDDGKTVDGPGRLTKRAFVEGVRRGRQGRGSIFVWASGNGGRKQDNCNCDGYTNSIYTLSISSATQSGAKPWYLEECSSTLATTYSSGSPGMDQNIVTVDMDTTYRRSLSTGSPVTTYLCTLSHTGTSASAPIAAAVVALALEANPKLTWRDMQHLVVATSRPEPLRWESGWLVNGVGRKYSHKFGYGLMDAEAMVRLAEVWTPVPAQRVCESAPMDQKMRIPVIGALEVEMRVDGCRGDSREIRSLEHVQARLWLKFKPRGNLKVTLVSPSGTPSTLLSPRIRDQEEEAFNEWPFLSVHFWGESPVGTWKLRIENSNLRASEPGTLLSWTMVLYGTYDPVDNSQVRNRSFHYLPRRTYKEVTSTTSDMGNECAASGMYRDHAGACLPACPANSFTDKLHSVCVPCDGSCGSCFGPGSDNCVTCASGRSFYGDRCLALCPDTHYADRNVAECLPCHSSCASCHEKPTTCKSCAKHLSLDSKSSRCLAPCSPRDGNNGTSSTTGNTCKCHSSCASCSGDSSHECLSCGPAQRLLLGQCISERCPPSYYETEEAECRPCHSSCRTCSGPSHSDCSDCPPDRLLNPATGVCSACPAGQFLDRRREEPACAACAATCSQCFGSGEQECRDCAPPFHLMASRCVPCCPSDGSASTHAPIPASSGNHSIAGRAMPDCCTCFHESSGPCLTTEHTRSISADTPVLVAHDMFPATHSSASRKSLLIVIVVFVVLAAGILVKRIRRHGGSTGWCLSASERQSVDRKRTLRFRLSSGSATETEYRQLALQDIEEEEVLFDKT